MQKPGPGHPILALDASGREASVCIRRDGKVLFDKVLDKGLTHSETLLPLVLEACIHCGLSPCDIALFAVTAGPGSFTGLRIGLALAKGMALPSGAPLAPVSTLLAVALAAAGQGHTQGTLIPALDARRGEVYWAAFDAAVLAATSGAAGRLSPDAAGPVDALAPLLATAPAPIVFVGSGADLCYTAYKETFDVRLSTTPFSIAGGAAVAAHTATANAAHTATANAADAAATIGREKPAVAVVSATAARLHYLRLSQAERERAEREAPKA